MNKSSGRTTMTDQRAVRQVIESLFRELDFIIYSEKEVKDMVEFPDKFVIRNSSYSSIYGQKGKSEFYVVDMVKNIRLRIEIKIQKTSGSVDEKFPYLYINAATSHDADVLIILDGGGYKFGAKQWLDNVIKDKWLINDDKKINMFNIVDGIKFLENKFK